MTASWIASIAFFVLSLLGAAITVNIYRPVVRRNPVTVLSFFGGWLAGELVPHHLALQAFVTLGFAGFGAFSHAPGLAGLFVTLGSWAGMLYQLRQGLGADKVLEAALHEGLGERYRAEIRDEIARPLTDDIDWRWIARPFNPRRPGVEKLKNIRFARMRGVNLSLDVYRNPAHPQGRPMLLQVHGGGWTVASKDHQALPLMNQLASRGWVCVSSNYRLSPHATFPDHLIDVKLAIKWMREYGPEYGGDPNFIAITGGSAGGHLSALAALTPNDPEYQPGFESVDTRLRVCVPFYGIYDFADRHGAAHENGLDRLLERSVMKGSQDEIPEEWERASPIARVTPEAPPFLVIHGDRDSLASVQDARHFVETLRKTSRAPTAYAELPGAQHAFEVFASPRTLHTIHAVERFLCWVYSRYLEERARGVGGSGDAI